MGPPPREVERTTDLLAGALSTEAQERVGQHRFGIVGAVLTPDGEIEIFELGPDTTTPESLVEAWSQVQAWTDEVRASAGGVVSNLRLVDPDDDASNDAYEVLVEGRAGDTVNFLVPFRRRRLRGLEFASPIYTEPDAPRLRFS